MCGRTCKGSVGSTEVSQVGYIVEDTSCEDANPVGACAGRCPGSRSPRGAAGGIGVLMWGVSYHDVEIGIAIGLPFPRTHIAAGRTLTPQVRRDAKR